MVMINPRVQDHFFPTIPFLLFILNFRIRVGFVEFRSVFTELFFSNLVIITSSSRRDYLDNAFSFSFHYYLYYVLLLYFERGRFSFSPLIIKQTTLVSYFKYNG